jgi:hypothetical protein
VCGTKAGHPQPGSARRDNVRAAANKLHRRRDSAINILPAGGERLSRSFAQRESLRRRRRPAVHSNEARGRESISLSHSLSIPGRAASRFFPAEICPRVAGGSRPLSRLAALDSNSATRLVDFGLLNCGEKQNKRARRCSIIQRLTSGPHTARKRERALFLSSRSLAATVILIESAPEPIIRRTHTRRLLITP